MPAPLPAQVEASLAERLLVFIHTINVDIEAVILACGPVSVKQDVIGRVGGELDWDDDTVLARASSAVDFGTSVGDQNVLRLACGSINVNPSWAKNFKIVNIDVSSAHSKLVTTWRRIRWCGSRRRGWRSRW